jgi:type I restriction enzyme S subunit
MTLECSLASLGDVVIPRHERARPQDFPDLPFVGMEHVQAQTTKLLGTAPTSSVRSVASRFYRGDVLYGRLRPYLNKVWLAEFDGLCSSEFIVFPPSTGLDSVYLKYRLNASDFVAFANSLNSGDRPRVDFEQLARFPFPLPPLPRQRTIAASLDAHSSRLSHVDGCVTRALANLEKYRASVLRAACLGELVPTEASLAAAEGRSFEHASELLERVLEDKRTRSTQRRRFREPADPNVEGLPALPEGWCWATPDQICDVVASGSTPAAHEMAAAGDIPFIKVYNLTFGGPIDFSVKPTFISQRVHEGLLARSRVHPGDVLMNIVGPPLGKVSLVQATYSDWNINQAIVLFRPSFAISAPLLAAWFRATPILHRLESTKKATAGQFNLQVTTCRKLPIPLPPLKEQQRIQQEITRLFSAIDDVQSKVLKTAHRTARLRQAILCQSFPQSPTEAQADV